MKRLSTLFAAITLLLASGCSKYDDSSLWNSVTSLEERVYQLEQLCNQMNTNISSLQTIVTALQTNDCITGITPVTEKGKEIGYTITFTQSSPITIYHGKEGEKGETGATGQNGHTPVIGAKQDTDGFYYWTLDGEWLTDGDNKIKAQGDAGPEGEPGITPQLKIENNYWEVSYDNGRSWTQLGKATGESSDSIFKHIDYTTSSDYVVFELFDGTTLQLPKISELAIDLAVNSLVFQIDETQTVSYLIKGGSADNVIKAELLNDDGGYTLRTVPESATYGKIEISAKIPTVNRVIISVSDGSHTIMTAIDVSIAPSFDGKTVTVAEPGTLEELLHEYDLSTITELTIIGSLNSNDLYALAELPNLSVLDMENVNMETLYDISFNFYFQKLTSIVLPRTLKEIGDETFWGRSDITNITIPSSVTTIGDEAFYNCSGLTGSLTIPNGVTAIGDRTFYGCSGLTDITIPSSVTAIGNSAFSDCSGLTDITIPNGVTAIGDWAFSWCSGLTGSLTIPSSVTAIGDHAFSNCSSIKQVYCKATTPPLLINCYSLPWGIVIYVPTGCIDAYWSKWKNKLGNNTQLIETEFNEL